MTNEEYRLMMQAADSVYSSGINSIPEGYSVVDYPFQDFNQNGFKAIAFKNEATGEFIIAFAGTEDLQDAHADVNLGWDQWKDDVRQDVLSFITNAIDQLGATKIHFTGHSLGGALAQYAFYEYISTVRIPGHETDDLPVEVDITTFNALGGSDGLKQNLLASNPYRESILNDIEGAHFYVEGDLVSRLGGGHVGGVAYEIPPFGEEKLNLIDAHLMKAVKTIINFDEFNNIKEKEPEYLNISKLQNLAAQYSTFLSIDNGVDNFEAKARLKLTVLGAINEYFSLAPSEAQGQLDELLSAIFQNLKESSDSNSEREIFETLESIPYEMILSLASGNKFGDAVIGLSMVVSAMMVAMSDSINWTFSELGLPPAWRDNMPDYLLDDLNSKISVIPFFTAFMPALELLKLLSAEHLPELSSNTFEIQEGQSDVMTLTLSEAHDRDLGVLIKVQDSERLKLSGENIILLDDTLGKYRVTFPSGETQLDIQVNHLMYGDLTDTNSQIDFYLVPLSEIHGALNDAYQSSVTITLSEYELPEDDTTTIDNTIKGDFEWVDFDDSEDGIQVQYDSLGNPIVDPDSSKTMDDHLNGSNNNDEILSGEGKDVINAFAGDDIVKAGMDDDIVNGGSGNDEIEGGWGTDILQGGDGDDELYADDKIDLEYMLDTDDIAPELTRDWLSGGNGDDLIVGNHGQNGLAGGDGKDTIFSGAGDDYIFGDADSVAQSFDWQANIVDGVTVFEPVTGAMNPLVGDQDTIHAGGGNDHVWGQWGNDIINGQGGEDILYGGQDDDVIYGGNDNDLLYGDRNSLDIKYHGNDLLNGGQGDDELVGQGGNDLLYGEEDNDRLFGDGNIDAAEHGDDSLSGGAGNDTLVGNGGSDYLFGGDGNDDLFGDDSNDLQYHGDDYMDGGKGDDTLQGHGGDDTLIGGDGNDILSGDAGADALYGGQGNDYLYGETSDAADDDHKDDYLDGGEGDDVLIGAGGNDLLSGGAGNDQLDGDGNDINQAIHGDDIIYGGSGEDTIWGSGGSDIISGGAGNDALFGDGGHVDTQYHGDDSIDGGSGDDQLYGYGGNDTLSGGEDNDLLSGGEGNDTLEGGSGNDQLYGNEGDDVLIGGSGNDTLRGGVGNDIMDGGSGEDIYIYDLGNGVSYIRDIGSNTLRFGSGIYFNNISLALGSLQIKIDGTDDAIHIENFDPDNPYDNVAIDRFEFADGTVKNYNELLELGIEFEGTDGDDTLIGTNTKDSLNGYAGNDTIIAKDGDDILNGGSGDDELYGNAGNDALDGGTGSDTMAGGRGDDTYQIDNINDTIIEAADEGFDTVQSQQSYTLSDHVEALELYGDAIEGHGNAQDNVIAGNAHNNILTGQDGNDTLNGMAGNDTLDGGAGIDTMIGGEGDDTYRIDNTLDSVVENTHSGHDTILSSVTYTLSNNVETLHLTGNDAINGVGNSQNNQLSGNNADNQLYGGDGNDTLMGQEGNDLLDGQAGSDNLLGGLGDDTYYLNDSGDQVIENPDEGNDTVYTDMEYQLGDNIENLILTGYQNLKGTGNELNNQITGNDRNNILDGRGGSDILIGRGGYDQYWVDQTTDVVIEDFNKGIDTVHSTASNYTLTDNIENFILEGNEAINGTANDMANQFTGNDNNNIMSGAGGNDSLNSGAGDDTLYGDEGNDSLNGDSGQDALFGGTGHDSLSGGEGDDYMAGGSGDDRYFVDSSDDVILELANEGYDTVYSSANYTLSDHVEILQLQDSAIEGIGSEQDNSILGNQQNNILSGEGGNDYLYGNLGQNQLFGGDGDDFLNGKAGDSELYGGTGNDRYYVDSATDRVIELQGEGYDSVESKISYTLTGEVEALELKGNQELSGTGNELDNYLLGNESSNVLSGLAGDDHIDGFAGNDYLYGHTGNDYLYGGDDINYDGEEYNSSGRFGGGEYSGAPNNDYLDGGSGNDYLDGGSGDDILYGGTGNDYLYGGDDGYYGGGENPLPMPQPIIAGDYRIETMDIRPGGDQRPANLSNNDYLNGGEGQDILDGGTGEDELYGGADGDTLYGGTGDDLLDGGQSFDQASLDTLSGQQGNDVYYVDGYSETTLVEVDDKDDSDDDTDACACQNWDEPTLNAGKGNEGVGNGEDPPPPGHDDNYNDGPGTSPGNPGSKGGANAQVDKQGDGTSTISETTSSNDSDSEQTCDTGDSGSGSSGDIQYIEQTTYFTDTVNEQYGEGYDIVYANITYTLTEHVEELHLTGTEDWDATGNAQDNHIYGNSANNILDGAQGNDWLYGGLGDDGYVVDSTSDQIIELAYAGQDTVYSTLSWQLTNHLENLTLMGEQAIDGLGNDVDNQLTGNQADNNLQGLLGNDVLSGGQGNDSLNGGDGDDTYHYQLGDGLDTLTDDNGQDRIVFGEGIGFDQIAVRTDTMNGITTAHLRILDQFGNEQVDQGMNITLDSQNNSPIETLVMADGAEYTLDELMINSLTYEGGNNKDELTLGREDDVVYAGKGNDWIEGGTGNDIIFGGSKDDTLLGQGGIDQLDGGDGQDALYGGGGNDLLFGNQGDDILVDGQGNDAIIGGQGNDAINLHCGNNTVLYNLGDGQDTLTMGEHVQGMTLSLGQGLNLDDISLQQSEQDLVVTFNSESSGSGKGKSTSNASSIVLSDWYENDHADTSLTLQTMSETDDTTTVSQYDLNAIIQAFDEQNAQGSVQSSSQVQWQITHAALDAHLSSSEEEALGGELAYGYGSKGSIDPFAATTFNTLKDEQFGSASQSFAKS